MIQLTYDPQADALYIRLRHAKVDESDEVSAGVIVDYDRKGKPVGIEVLDASRFVGSPPNLQVDLTPAEFIKRSRVGKS